MRGGGGRGVKVSLGELGKGPNGQSRKWSNGQRKKDPGFCPRPFDHFTISHFDHLALQAAIFTPTVVFPPCTLVIANPPPPVPNVTVNCAGLPREVLRTAVTW